jgi:thiol-disulfide isomerase/thioredoxin
MWGQFRRSATPLIVFGVLVWPWPASVSAIAGPASATARADEDRGDRSRSGEGPERANGDKLSFVLEDLAGVRWDFSTSRAGINLVNFFATWCESCREELPMLQRLLGRISNVAVFAISVGEPDDRVRRFLASTPLAFPVVLDRDRAVAKAWRVATLPTTFVLDRGLELRRIVEGEFAWDRVDAAQLLSIGGPDERD